MRQFADIVEWADYIDETGDKSDVWITATGKRRRFAVASVVNGAGETIEVVYQTSSRSDGHAYPIEKLLRDERTRVAVKRTAATRAQA